MCETCVRKRSDASFSKSVAACYRAIKYANWMVADRIVESRPKSIRNRITPLGRNRSIKLHFFRLQLLSRMIVVIITMVMSYRVAALALLPSCQFVW